MTQPPEQPHPQPSTQPQGHYPVPYQPPEQTAPQPSTQPQGHYPVPYQAPPQLVHVVHPAPRPFKDTTVAYLLWFFLGSWGAHQFYMNNGGMAALYIVLNLLGLVTIVFLVGLVFWIPLFILWIVDGCLLAGKVRDHNARVSAGY